MLRCPKRVWFRHSLVFDALAISSILTSRKRPCIVLWSSRFLIRKRWTLLIRLKHDPSSIFWLITKSSISLYLSPRFLPPFSIFLLFLCPFSILPHPLLSPLSFLFLLFARLYFFRFSIRYSVRSSKSYGIHRIITKLMALHPTTRARMMRQFHYWEKKTPYKHGRKERERESKRERERERERKRE